MVAYHELQETASDTRPPQLQIYDLCLQKYGANHTWMLFTDADEFVVVKQGGTLPVLLHAYEEHAALVLNWQVRAGQYLLDDLHLQRSQAVTVRFMGAH